MSEQEAIEILKHHSFNNENLGNSKAEKGFLGMLRPFNGTLNEENFHELMNVLLALKDHFSKEIIDRNITSNLWAICHLTRSWAIERDAMLRRNNLINDTQIDLLTIWIDCISITVMYLLEGLGDLAFDSYNAYLNQKL